MARQTRQTYEQDMLRSVRIDEGVIEALTVPPRQTSDLVRELADFMVQYGAVSRIEVAVDPRALLDTAATPADYPMSDHERGLRVLAGLRMIETALPYDQSLREQFPVPEALPVGERA